MTNLIQTTRFELGITGAELARRLEVSTGAISQMERSERDGAIRLETLRRALAAMGRRMLLDTLDEESSSPYGAEAITDAMNQALDEGNETFALRLLTRAVQVIREHPETLTLRALTERPSQIKDPKWETMFRALYGESIPDAMRPAWAKPEALKRRWYVSQFAPLREKSKETTPSRLRDLNIFIDERSLARA